MPKSGHGHGNRPPFTYAAYVYFEKLRIKQRKPKSKKREEMEANWGKKKGPGSAKLDLNQRFWKHESQRVYVSQFGKIELVRDGKEPRRNDGIERKWRYYG
jgi:hypothetical protein